MTTQIELTEMCFYAYHGVSPQETKVGNFFKLDLILTAPLQKAIVSDDIHDTINYATVYTLVEKEMIRPSKLLEHVAGRIVNALKNNFPQLAQIDLSVTKLNPPIGGDIKSVSVILKETFS